MKIAPFAGLLLALCLAGCASEVKRQGSALSLAAGTPVALVTTSPVSFTLDSGYSRAVAEGTAFSVIGTVTEGRVLKPVDSTFTIEGAHMHEAYPVERDGKVVGFYLPVEKAYSPLSWPRPFPTTERKR